jgi:hypothetical protein
MQLKFLIKEMMLQEIVCQEIIVAIEELEHEFWNVKVRTCIMIYTLVSLQFLVFKDIEA